MTILRILMMNLIENFPVGNFDWELSWWRSWKLSWWWFSLRIILVMILIGNYPDGNFDCDSKSRNWNNSIWRRLDIWETEEHFSNYPRTIFPKNYEQNTTLPKNYVQNTILKKLRTKYNITKKLRTKYKIPKIPIYNNIKFKNYLYQYRGGCQKSQ